MRQRRLAPNLTQPSAEFCRPAAAGAILSCSRSKLYDLTENDPDFPAKIRLGARCVGWRRSDLEAYLELKAEKM
jgi:predicted DNA-binding transcriptional regulator AlpA